MSQFYIIICNFLKVLIVYAISLLESFGQLFGIYKNGEDQLNHGDSIVRNKEAEMQREFERKGLLLLRKLKRIELMLYTLVNDKPVYQKLQAESNLMTTAEVVLDLAFRRKKESRLAKKAKQIERQFTKMRDEIFLQCFSQPSSLQYLCNIFPLEVWEAVANQCDDAQSWMNIYNINPVLQTLLQGKRTTVLLPEILKIVYGTVSRDILGATELSCCRLVCKKWRRSVDDVLDDQQIRLSFCREYSTGMMTWTSNKHPTSFANSFMSESVERLLLEPYAGIRPFPSGHLVVNEVIELTADIVEFRLSVSRMLRNFGSHVKYFGFKNDADYNPITWYFFLMRWLRLMPNLKRLDLEFCLDDGQVRPHENFNVNKFPRLENLRVLQVENVPGSVISCVLRSNPQIQKLRIIREKNIHFPLWKLPRNMSSLSHLFILAYSYRDIVQLEKIVSHLEAVQIETSPSTGIYNAHRAFRALEKFHASLNYLKLELQSPPDAGLFLHLPQLSELNLIFHADINLDFILPLKSLRNFSVNILNRRFRPGIKFEIIKFNSCIENMKESNIWDLFPHLELVSIYTYNCRFEFKGQHTFVCRRPQLK